MKEFKNIKNIIFDLGGVIVNIDYSLTINAFKNLGINNFEELFSQASQNNLFDLIDKGKISSPDFRKKINSLSGKEFEDYTIDTAWNAMLLDLPKQRLEQLKKIKLSHRTFLLSNTNEIHIDEFSRYLIKKFGIPDLSTFFDKVYLSYKVGMRKPDAEIFNLILEQNNLKPEETIFIDDSIQHIEGAKKLGIKTYWLDTKKESLSDFLAKLY